MMHLVQKSLQGRRSSPKNKQNEATEASRMIEQLNLSTFPQFMQLQEEIRRHILLFVASGPMEHKVTGPLIHAYHPGALTSTLPLVNREFHRWSNLDYFWEPVMKRQIIHEFNGALWVEGLCRLLPPEHALSIAQSPYKHGLVRPEQVLAAVLQKLGETLTYKQLYQKVFNTHIQFDAPIFMMPCHLRIGESYGLHLFEPRYCIMIHNLINATRNPAQAASGGTIEYGTHDGVVTPPLLIHANLGSRLFPGECACLVQVVECEIFEQGNANVRLLPVAWVRFDRIWVRTGEGHLFYAKATRLPSQKEIYNSV
jgi:hypothetical protein